MSALLDIAHLSVDIDVRQSHLRLVDGIDLHIGRGETVCLVGESGSGKTVTALSVLRLIDFKGGAITEGVIGFSGRNLANLSQRQMSDLRGRRIGIVFQDPMTAFDPLFSIGHQIGEVLRRHRGTRRTQARAETIALLRRVQLPDPELRVDLHPHALSGGQRQRAMIAMALACGPELLIADEPTTALDVTIQAQILQLLRNLQTETGMGILLITHDLGIAAEMADRVVVMYAGRIVESAVAPALFANPAHPYTRGLLGSVIGSHSSAGTRLVAIAGTLPGLSQLPEGCRFHPRCPIASAECRQSAPPLQPRDGGAVACWHPQRGAIAVPLAAPIVTPAPAPARATLLEAVDLYKTYPGSGRQTVKAVSGVSLRIEEGETLGLVGESGCGKSTLGRLLLHLEPPTRGRIRFAGEELTTLPAGPLRRLRRQMQIIFQDPYSSIDPRWTLGRVIAAPLVAHESLGRDETRTRVRGLLQQVGLDPNWETRHASDLSGGQRQRVAIARAIALNPRFIVADEAVSALDVSVQAQVINLMQALKQELGLTYLFIGHGLNLVRHISDRIGVMYLGRLVEIGPAETVFRSPAHPYTHALLASIPQPDPALRRSVVSLGGEIPSATNPPPGCAFHTRCPRAVARCHSEVPVLAPRTDRHAVACHDPL